MVAMKTSGIGSVEIATIAAVHLSHLATGDRNLDRRITPDFIITCRK